MTESPLLTTADAARYLLIHRTTLATLVREGKIAAVTHSDAPGAKLSFHRADLDAYLETRRKRRSKPKKPRREPKPVDADAPWRTSA